MTDALQPPRYWRVVFDDAGAIESISEIAGTGRADWEIVQAPTEEAARRKAYNRYAARKKREVISRKHAQGQCRCGRPQDRKRPDGTLMKLCSVCAERNEVWRTESGERKAAGVTDHQRDEVARVASHQQRQRDRRAEIRLETLLEVKRRWIESHNIQQFGAWLRGEVDNLTGAQRAKGEAA